MYHMLAGALAGYKRILDFLELEIIVNRQL